MRTVHHEWDYQPEPRPRREPRIAATVELTVERSKPNLMTRFAGAYFRATMFAIKLVASVVLTAIIVASIWFLVTLIQIAA
jgi:hypothetical protein